MARSSLCKIRLHPAVTDGRHVPVLHPKEVDFPESDLESTKVCCWLGDVHWYEVAWNANGLVAKAVVAARSKRTAGLTRCVLRFIKMQLLP